MPIETTQSAMTPIIEQMFQIGAGAGGPVHVVSPAPGEVTNSSDQLTWGNGPRVAATELEIIRELARCLQLTGDGQVST